MGEPKLTGFLIAILVVGFLAGSISLFMSYMNEEYSDVTYDDSLNETYNKMDNITQISKDIQARTQDRNTTSGIDILGDIFQGGYDTMRISYSSISLFNSMSQDAAESEALGITTPMLISLGVGVVLILVLIGVIVAILVRAKQGGL